MTKKIPELPLSSSIKENDLFEKWDTDTGKSQRYPQTQMRDRVRQQISLQNAYDAGAATVDFSTGKSIVLSSELNSIATAVINSGGTGYTQFDILTVVGGTSSIVATLRVETESAGVITSISIQNSGLYSIDPPLGANAVTGGTGSGATIDLTVATAGKITINPGGAQGIKMATGHSFLNIPSHNSVTRDSIVSIVGDMSLNPLGEDLYWKQTGGFAKVAKSFGNEAFETLNIDPLSGNKVDLDSSGIKVKDHATGTRSLTINFNTINQSGDLLRWIAPAFHFGGAGSDYSIPINRTGAVDNGILQYNSTGNTYEHTSLTAVSGDIDINALGGTPLDLDKGGTGQITQTAAFDALAPTTTKGDITVHNGTDNIRLAVGPDGTSPVANSAQATGIEWVNVQFNNIDGVASAVQGGTGQSSYTIGDTLYASGTTALSKLAAVATGNALISGGVGAAPSWGKIGLTTHVTGILPIDNGGTGVTTTSNGQLLIGDSTGPNWVVGNLATGSAKISVTTGAGTLSIDAVESAFNINDLGGTPLDLNKGGTGAITKTSAFDALSPLTNKGDLVVYDNVANNNVKFGVGADAFFLQADSSVAGVGLKWTQMAFTEVNGTCQVNQGGTGLTSYTTGDLIYADGATSIAKLAGVALGNALISGGVGAAPSWGKIDLTTHVTGATPIANGGTGQTTQTAAFDALAPSTTKGDIIVHNGTDNIRLPVGADGQFLKADSSETSGLIWGNPIGLFSQTNSVTVANTVTETTIVGTGQGTLTIPANGFAAGDSFITKVGGEMRTNGAAQTIRLRVKTGSVVLADTGTFTLSNITSLRFFEFELDFTIRTIGAATVASIITNGQFCYVSTAGGGNYEGEGFNTINNTTFDTTVSNTLDITVEWGAADANNAITTNQLILSKTF